MMDLEFSSKASKLEKEQQKRKEEAKKRLAKQREEEAARLAERAREKARLEALELARQEEEAKTPRGTYFSGLVPYLIENFETNDDRIILPPSTMDKLDLDSLGENRIITFKIYADISPGAIDKFPLGVESSASMDTSSEGEAEERVTHCGLREFSATEGTVGVTQKIIDSLHCELKDIKSLSIERMNLPLGKYAKLQPYKNEFYRIMEVKACLEENLNLHATMSVGDILHIWHRGEPHYVRVLELKPSNYVRVNNSDLNIDIDNSVEYYEHLEKSKISKNNESMTQMQSNSSSVPISENLGIKSGGGHKLGAGEPLSETNTVASVMNNSLGSVFRLEKEEPLVGSGDIVNIKLRVSRAAQPLDTISRRFLRNENFSDLFVFLAEKYNVSNLAAITLNFGFPPKELRYNDEFLSKSFVDLGISSAQEMIRVTL